MKIVDLVDPRLISLAYGSFSVSSIDTPIDNLINIDSKINKNDLDQNFSELIELSLKNLELIDKENEIEYYTYGVVVLADLFYMNKQFEKSLDYLKQVTLSIQQLSSADQVSFFHFYLSLRSIYLKLSIDNMELENCLVELNNIQLPSKSNVMGRYYLDLVIAQISILLKEKTFDQLEKIFIKNYNLFISFITYHYYNFKKFNSKELSSYCNNLIKKFNETIKFPSAKQNNFEYEFFLDNLFEKIELYPNIITIGSLKQVLINSFGKTFQSISILKNFIILLINESDTNNDNIDNEQEIISSFRVYLEYNDKFKLLNKNQYRDLLEIIYTFTRILKYLTNFKNHDNERIELINSYSFQLYDLLKILNRDLKFDYYLENDIDIDNGNHLSCLDNKIYANELLSYELSKSWYTLAMSFKYLAEYDSPLLEDVHKYLKYAIANFQNAIKLTLKLNNENHVFFYDYAIVLTKLNKLKPSLKLIKLCLTVDNLNFKYWNFLILLYSSIDNENFKNLEKLINNSVLLLNQELEDEQFLSNLSIIEKYNILQLKMTHLSLIELMNKDLYPTLEYLPELFKLYNRLFGNVVESSHLVINKNDDNGTIFSSTVTSSQQYSHRPSIANPLKSDHHQQQQRQAQLQNGKSEEKLNGSTGLNKSSKSIRKRIFSSSNTSKNSNAPHARIITNGKSHPPEKKVERAILQELWLFASTLYLKASYLQDSENCIIEAENCYEINSKTHSKLGLLTLITNRLKLSFQEFEISIDLDDKNLESILGLAKLFLETENNEEIFINLKDRQAAEIRIKFFLENIANDYKFLNYGEIYYFLSIIYEKYQDFTQLNKSLWKCIELEEIRPVRDFGCIEKFPY